MTSEEVFAGVLYEMLTGRRFGRGTACIWRVSGQGGMPEVLVPVGEGEWAHGPQMLPGGDAILFTVSTTGALSWDDAQIVAQSLSSGERAGLSTSHPTECASCC